ncbi:phage tail protein [uncultured Desulfovibrio sp.]|uniref:phage tail protein n=1 Tax=uncultured Desulfovibrio sp. TaxID=167968 RepID=UPI002639E309|nr:phage tail protein [uncultured Desulfovibrio sp.]
MAKCYQYTADGYFAGETEDYGLLPNNSTRTAPTIVEGKIPRWTGKKWEQVEDHKGKSGYVNGQPYEIKEYGPLPKGWSDTPPPPSLSDAQAAKAASIVAAHETALAGAIAMSDPTPSNVAVEAGLLAVSDPEGLEYVRNALAAQRDALLAAVDAAETAETVQAIAVSYAV